MHDVRVEAQNVPSQNIANLPGRKTVRPAIGFGRTVSALS